jgi:APA family basic amino acid/polyamine antiporter
MSTARTQGISLITATAVVVANMIGTGVFTSLGFQVGPLPSGFVIMMLWIVGGVCAFCGAVCYGELAAAMPRSGGEYHYLTQIFSPAAGFLAGWLSATVGFAAPIALAAMAFGKYFSGALPWANAEVLSHGIVIAMLLVHLIGVNVGAKFQNVATWLKVLLIVVFIAAGLLMPNPQPVSFLPVAGDGERLMSPAFAVSLVFVMYAYTGWNAVTYIVGEVKNPARNLPLAVAIGTLIVAVLYVGLNGVFLRAAPMSELAGKVDVGHTAADFIFGAQGGRIMALLISGGLISAISAMTWVGPRVMMAMGEDVKLLAPLGKKSASGVPWVAMIVQTAIVLALLHSGKFEKVLTYVQFSLTLCSFLTVLGVMVLRRTRPDLPRPYRAWGYPVTPLLFMAVSLWMMWHILRSNPVESLAGLGTILLGLIIFLISPRTPRSA